MHYVVVAKAHVQGHRRVYGLPVRIQNRVGSIRRGKEPDGTPWATRMRVPYGYFKDVPGLDGDALDLFLGPDTNAPDVYLITTMKYPDYCEPDEIKVFAQFASASAARRCFDAHYPGVPRAFGGIRWMPVARFTTLIAACHSQQATIAP